MKNYSAGAVAAWLLLLGTPLALAASSEARVTPIQKVLGMLGDMVKKAKVGKQAERVEWAAFKTMCSNVEVEKQTSIQKADVQKQALKADQEQHDSEVKRLAKEIVDHQADIAAWKKDEAKATKDRKGERQTYQKTHADYSESIDAITNAIATLKKRAMDIPQAASLLQVLRSRTPESGLLSMGVDVVSKELQSLEQAPKANSYEFQSDGIIDMLKDLKEKFIDERTSLEKKEMVMRQAYDVVMMDLRNSIAAAENEIDKKGRSKAENIAGSTESSTLYDETSASRDDDQEYLTKLISTCQTKASDFNTRQQLHDEEIGAIEKAIEIISGDAVSGSAEKHLPSLLQVRKASSFVQFLAALQNPSNQQKAIAFLTGEGQRLESHVLSALAITATADPFDKVKKMISDLITKLKKQEEEEAGHKQWCDDELKTNGQTRKDKTSEVDSLTSTIDQLESRLAVLKKDLAALAKGIADLKSADAKATEIRESEKDTNEATIVEAVNGQTAIAQATKILTDFYKKAGANKAFIQRDSQPTVFDEAFKGQQKQSSNVLAFLDVISSDFARLEGDTKKAESDSQAEYDDLMSESNKSRDAKEKEQKTKEKEQLDKTGVLANKNDDLDMAQQQLNAALNYFDKLKPSCVNVNQDNEERVQRREEEIASLKEALEILNGEGVPSGPESLYSSTQGGNLAVDYR